MINKELVLAKHLPPTKYFPPSWLRFLIITLLISGIFFRFAYLDRKVYWHDEAYTSLRISGYTKTEFVQQVFNGRVFAVENIQKYQQPNSEKGLIDTVNSLAMEDAQHPPLYYVILRLWMQFFGNSVATTRSLSAIISLLAFPCIYWLCLELFQSSITAWISVALLTISPFHVLYAQEAREFGLWMVTILLESAVLLRAIRLGSKKLWGIYAVTVAVGLYTFLFSGLLAIAYGIYIFAIERFRFTKPVKAYLIATSTGFLAFVPWILTVINSLSVIDSTTASAQTKQSLSALVSGWISNISYLFGDFWRYEPFFPDLNLPILRWGRFLIPLILILVIYSFFFLYRQAERRVWLFVFILSGVTALALILPDLIIGGKLSLRARYVIPCYIGIQLAVAYLLATQIISSKLIVRNFWQLVMVVVISSGIISCAVSSQAETWWNKGSHNNPEIARIINKANNPLLISSNYSLNIGDIMSLIHLLDPKVQMQLVTEPSIPNIPNRFSNLFLYNPSQRFRSDLEKKYKLVDVFQYGRLWRLEAKSK
ncbi:MAG: glycosyltransferase family 39 protein [Nostoc sp. DedVER02]|uniref:glycosyltransferase family 39 protein n=1 Tax=unclassified Nostoc TaxID=2593658 RepID=UPI002AD563DF|nr:MULTISPECIES: glycosyltransferase family 39 protein [unclassified Nostoc]MDZ7990192.1 glycosyltransferase family 39 protein [Nostoc sp. DedVER02]MDZ8116407.1 glycosyltransferase family 39 protein [Nostoc sp. DedVER01b]